MLRTKKILPGAYEVLNTGDFFKYRVSTKRKNIHARARRWNIYRAKKVKGAKWELIDDDFSTKEEAVDWALDYVEEDNKKINERTGKTNGNSKN